MGQHDKGMSCHPFRPELKHRGVGEGLSQDDRRWDPAFFELNRVVHTAQRAGPSAANRGDGDLHLLGHRLN